MNKKVVLVHGYNKGQADMTALKENLEQLDYKGIAIDLPLNFTGITEASPVFKEQVAEIIFDLEENEQINLVGHSTGGLIIRNFLAKTEYLNKINRAVLIATPNSGSQLAKLAGEYSKLFVRVFKTLNSLQPEQLKEIELDIPPEVEVGAIAGNKEKLVLGKLLAGENDGRVLVESVQDEDLADFVVLPYGHKEIHYKFKTAQLVDSFLKRGRFN